MREFHRSATTGLKSHAGGQTFYHMFGGDTGGLYVSVHLPVGIDPRRVIINPYIAYAERRLIWDFVQEHGRLPVCNSE